MAITKEQKKGTVEKFRRHETDSGSQDVQIALLTERINDLSKHLQAHPKDQHSRRGLTLMVSRRNRLLEYLRRTEPEKYQKLIETLGLRK